MGKQAQGVQCLRNPQQFLLLTRGQHSTGKESLHGCLSLIVGTPHFTPVSLFRCELHGGLKTVDIHAQRPLEFSELTIGEFADEAIIADDLPHDLPIFLLNVTLVVTAPRPSSGKDDVLLFAKR